MAVHDDQNATINIDRSCKDILFIYLFIFLAVKGSAVHGNNMIGCNNGW